MKKLQLGAVVGVGSLLLLTGCGGSGESFKCPADFEEEGHKYSAELKVELDGDKKVKDADSTMIFENEDDANQFYSSYQMIINLAKQFAEDDKDIPEIDIKQSGKKVTISNYASLLEMNSDDEEQESIVGMTKDEFIKKLQSNTDNVSWKCE